MCHKKFMICLVLQSAKNSARNRLEKTIVQQASIQGINIEKEGFESLVWVVEGMIDDQRYWIESAVP